jgi:steroid delta-isomerase-like uncharacterized protein
MHRRVILERSADCIAAWNRGDADGVVAHALEDLLWRDVALPMPLSGRDAFRTALQGFMAAFPGMQVAVTSQTVEGPRLAQEWTATGTHRGELMGIPPTGRASQIYGVTVAVFDEEARLIEGSTYWNPLALMHQLGVVMPVPEAVATSS